MLSTPQPVLSCDRCHHPLELGPDGIPDSWAQTRAYRRAGPSLRPELRDREDSLWADLCPACAASWQTWWAGGAASMAIVPERPDLFEVKTFHSVAPYAVTVPTSGRCEWGVFEVPTEQPFAMGVHIRFICGFEEAPILSVMPIAGLLVPFRVDVTKNSFILSPADAKNPLRARARFAWSAFDPT